MAALDDFIALVGLEIPDCPEPIVSHQVITSAQEYCARSSIWQVEMDAETVSPTDPTLDLIPDEGIVDRVELLYVDGDRVYPVGKTTLPDEWTTETGTTQGFIYETESTIRLYPIPVADVSVTGYLVVKPKARGPIPQWLYDNELHREGILAGALARLYRLPKKPWLDLAQATAMGSVFESKISRAAIRVHRGELMRIKLMEI